MFYTGIRGGWGVSYFEYFGKDAVYLKLKPPVTHLELNLVCKNPPTT